ncbi:MAG: acetate--CoA ligase [Thermoplasmata archaeon]
MSEETLSTLLKEERKFLPSKEVIERATVKDWEKVLKEASENPLRFWEEAANELEWFQKWEKVLDDSNKPFFKWFAGGKCNITVNALDRHLSARANKVAILFEGEPGDVRKLTYAELYKEVCKFANALKKLGVKKGDRVTTYLPNIPEQAITMLACARIGAMHSVVYAGFSKEALRDRIMDAEAKVVVTADGTFRRGKTILLKPTVDEAIATCPSVEKVVVVKRANVDVSMQPGRDYWFHELIANESDECKAEVMEATDPLFILYTSGTTGKPKGVVHVHGGYMVGVHRTMKWIFDIKEEDIFWCTADPGWITGHSYIVYGPLMVGTTTIMSEAVPDYPQPDRWWSMVEKHKVTIFYTAPTAIRAMMKNGEEWPNKHDLSSLRLLGSVGEPINPEAWHWYYRVIGKEKCPIMDTWWQTETGMVLITPLPVSPLKPGSATKPFPGIIADVVDSSGKSLPPNQGGFLVIKTPWPAMMATIYKDPDRYVQTYWKKLPGDFYVAGDVARKDEDGYFWIQGRADDVLKISGHRIGTMEVESAFVSHPAVAEAAVVGVPDEVKGEVIKAFVILKAGHTPSPELAEDIKKHVRKELGPVAVIKDIEFRDKLPKTRSGKIMRRVLKAEATGKPIGDITTLED